MTHAQSAGVNNGCFVEKKFAIRIPRNFSITPAMKFRCFTLFSFCYCAILLCDATALPCTTPNGEKAECVPLQLCPILRDAIIDRWSYAEDFVAASFCDSADVCCGTTANFIPKPSVENINITTVPRIDVDDYSLPNEKYCGIQQNDEFPWMIQIYPFCNSFLISNRYILTNDNCFALPDGIKIVTNNQEPNCTQTQEGVDCGNLTQRIKAEKQMTMPNSRISLIRLEKKIAFTSKIRPICLPMKDSQRPQANESVVSTEWKFFDSLTEKRIIEYRIVSRNECLTVTPGDVNHTDSYKCARPLESPEILGSGDGSPIMYKYEEKWFADGIVLEHELNYSSSKTMFFVHLTDDVLKWILETMRK